MKYCGQCGKPISALFCSYCGAKSEIGTDAPTETKSAPEEQSAWNAVGPNDEPSTADFRPNWWIRGGLVLICAFAAYGSFPFAWRTLHPEHYATQQANPQQVIPQQPRPVAKTTAQPSPRDPVLDIWTDAAKDAIAQYQMVKKSGSPADLCLQAAEVSSAFLQAKDDLNYSKWKRTEILDCGRAGMGDQAAYLKALADEVGKEGENSDAVRQMFGLPAKQDQNANAPPQDN